MSQNIERFKKDLSDLMLKGNLLAMSMESEIHTPEKMKKRLTSQLGKDDAEKIMQKLPSFNTAYEAWFSTGLRVVKQLIPDRLDHFKDIYEIPKNRKDITYATYRIQDYLIGLRVSKFGEIVVGPDAGLLKFRQQLAIVKSAEERFTSSLFEIKQILQADLFDAEVDEARELLKKGFLRAAGAVSGVVLEKHLKQTCENHNINISKKNPGIGDLNELLKSNSVVDVPQWRHISMLADIRNICDHNKSKEPTKEQVADLIDGTEKIIKTIS
ncbi:HEPN domain-containing protein [Methylobacterium terricola]|uniref:HEPN domain-containing protein n=1 Tax=Methylobacterium terricola TaxID=2583531 RepID=A0A5C4LGB8_9HYPH|nr:HEPN domain-containing protein [Methylobacterium terricola]TNC12267.1 HEPN domain-containing protein [Methylobacterium terricola]